MSLSLLSLSHATSHSRVLVTLLSCILFLQPNWDFIYSFSDVPQFSVPLALLAPASRFQESQSKIEYDSSSAFCTVRIGDLCLWCMCGTHTVGINFCTFTEMSMNCSLVNLHSFSGRLGQLLLNYCSIGHLVDSPGCSATVSLHLHLDDFGLHCSRLARSPVIFLSQGICLCNLAVTSLILSMCCFCEVHTPRARHTV